MSTFLGLRWGRVSGLRSPTFPLSLHGCSADYRPLPVNLVSESDSFPIHTPRHPSEET